MTNDKDYLWIALWLPLGGLMFDFFDGKVARWRQSASLLGQELDSLADLVRVPRTASRTLAHAHVPSACLLPSTPNSFPTWPL